jgi:hypothetical protein
MSPARALARPAARRAAGPLAAGLALASALAHAPIGGPRTAAADPAPPQLVGHVFHDDNHDRVRNPGEAGLARIQVLATAGARRDVVASAFTGATGRFEIALSAAEAATELALEVVPPPGAYPTTAARIAGLACEPGRAIDAGGFGLAEFERIALRSGPAAALLSGDLMEKDWSGDRAERARHDADLVVAQLDDAEPLQVWFNHYDSNVLFTTRRSYGLAAPRPPLCLASAPGTPSAGLDLIAGTSPGPSGNFFVWRARSTRGNEGYLPARHSLAGETLDRGAVQAVAIGDLGGNGPEIVIGTRSPGTERGSVERWSVGAAGLRRDEVYPSAGDPEAVALGEVTAIGVARLGGPSGDVVVGTRTGGGGQLVLLRGPRPGGRLAARRLETIAGASITSLTCADYDLDGRTDVVAGLAAGDGRGELRFFRNRRTGDSLDLVEQVRVALDAVPLAIASGDLGGGPHPDIVLGLRGDPAGPGGVRLLFMDGGVPASRLLDPAGGALRGSVSALVVGDFNRGDPPADRTPGLADIAIGARTGPTSGAVLVLVR